jgi:hypothetical protein
MFNVDLNLVKKLDQGMRAGEAVELPFPVVYVWALNGQASYKSQGGALYFGGWACKSDDLEAVTRNLSLPIPENWKQVTIASRDGGEFEAYTSRTITVAPIGKRISWLHDGNRSANYIEGGRRHLQVLAFMANARGSNGASELSPWGPVVLTAKGYQARNLLDAFTRWEKATAQLRWKLAPGIPAWCFFMTLGTFGKERQALNVGKPGAQSPITPISAHLPANITDEKLQELFVGNEVVELMANFQDQANEWLNAWKESMLIEGEEDQETLFQAEEEIPF